MRGVWFSKTRFSFDCGFFLFSLEFVLWISVKCWINFVLFFFRISFLSSFVFLDPLLSGDLRNIGMEVGSSHFFKWKRKKNEIKKLFSLSIFDIISVQLRIPFFFSFSQTKRTAVGFWITFLYLLTFFVYWFGSRPMKLRDFTSMPVLFRYL